MLPKIQKVPWRDEAIWHDARILIVDDLPANVHLLECLLASAGYVNFSSLTDSLQVEAAVLASPPDMILLDLMMPQLDGFDLLERLQPFLAPPEFLPIIVLTSDISPEIKRRALSAGARDFLLKPFDATEVLLRIRNLLDTRQLYIKQQKQNRELEKRVKERTQELERSQIEVLERLARAAEFRDDHTGHHTQRVGLMARNMARLLGLSSERIEHIRRAAPLHDIGKIGIPDRLLLKADQLTDEEFNHMKTHAIIGASLLEGGQSKMTQIAQSIALTHHERWDGSGYPYGLKGRQIPLEGRILAIADVFDALTHSRPYKDAWTPEQAAAEIARCSGTHFDPQLVEIFLRVLEIEAAETAAEAVAQTAQEKSEEIEPGS